MSNTYLFALTDGGGTVAPEVGVAHRLAARGQRVEVLAEDSMAEAVAAVGAVFHPWRHGLNRPDHRPEHAPYKEWELHNPARLVRSMIEHLITGPAEGYAVDVTDALQANPPDLVVVSFFAFGAMVAAEANAAGGQRRPGRLARCRCGAAAHGVAGEARRCHPARTR